VTPEKGRNLWGTDENMQIFHIAEKHCPGSCGKRPTIAESHETDETCKFACLY